jgi:hypothetical protein
MGLAILDVRFRGALLLLSQDVELPSQDPSDALWWLLSGVYGFWVCTDVLEA